MTIEEIAHDDFDHALTKGFWRKILGHLRREDNELLPYEEVREKLPILGQHYAGVNEVPLDRIVGSIGRFRDFDRCSCPPSGGPEIAGRVLTRRILKILSYHLLT